MIVALIGPWDFVIIAAVVLFIFGTRPFMRTFRSLRAGGKEFKRGIKAKDKTLPPPAPKSDESAT